MTRVVIADDQALVRTGFTMILAAASVEVVGEAASVEVVGEAANGLEAVAADVTPDHLVQTGSGMPWRRVRCRPSSPLMGIRRQLPRPFPLPQARLHLRRSPQDRPDTGLPEQRMVRI
jgi:hypothetical protein